MPRFCRIRGHFQGKDMDFVRNVLLVFCISLLGAEVVLATGTSSGNGAWQGVSQTVDFTRCTACGKLCPADILSRFGCVNDHLLRRSLRGSNFTRSLVRIGTTAQSMRTLPRSSRVLQRRDEPQQQRMPLTGRK